ncbi:MAG: TolC family protein [Gammaproteobacteria bacterium]|nr:TolC family protein [Gammaproteobacteria bacterium]
MKNQPLNRNVIPLAILTACLAALPVSVFAKPVLLPLSEFIQNATAKDTNFEAILLELLPLQYRRDALLPDRDAILSLKQQLHYFQGGSVSAGTSISLSKLFPDTGTDISAAYNKPATASGADFANLQLLVSQPIAKNAFGKAIKLQDSIIGIENEISRYQIVEAYEDYLSSLSIAWYNWYSAHENLKVADTARESTQRLLDNILERQRQKIALPVDVNKIRLSLIAKQESVIALQEIYDNLSNLIFSAMRREASKDIIPAQPDTGISVVDYLSEYQQFTQYSRTYRILNLLERQGTMEVSKAADNLLPSTNLLLGYQLDGEEWGSRNQENSFFAGIALTWPIGQSNSKAKQEIARIQQKKTLLSNSNKYEALDSNLKNLHLQIKREQKLMEISRKKIQLAEAILKAESENYSFGKISLNDYITAVNNVDENRFNYTAHNVLLNKLYIEWLRLTDRLVDDNSVLP